jgi:hypothetical protein
MQVHQEEPSCHHVFTYNLDDGNNNTAATANKKKKKKAVLYVPLTSRCCNCATTLPLSRGPNFTLPAHVVACLLRVRDVEQPYYNAAATTNDYKCSKVTTLEIVMLLLNMPSSSPVSQKPGPLMRGVGPSNKGNGHRVGGGGDDHSPRALLEFQVGDWEYNWDQTYHGLAHKWWMLGFGIVLLMFLYCCCACWCYWPTKFKSSRRLQKQQQQQSVATALTASTKPIPTDNNAVLAVEYELEDVDLKDQDGEVGWDRNRRPLWATVE